MSWQTHYLLLAKYNRWMNEQLYRWANTLGEGKLKKDCGAFFGSVFGTLNHIMVGDLIWLSRFSTHPDNCEALNWITKETIPTSLDDYVCSNFSDLTSKRKKIDELIESWLSNCSQNWFSEKLTYTSTEGTQQEQPVWICIAHFFNHQTHHRGQATTLLSQFGVELGVTDLSLFAKSIDTRLA